jgi:hypothetical protein
MKSRIYQQPLVGSYSNSKLKLLGSHQSDRYHMKTTSNERRPPIFNILSETSFILGLLYKITDKQMIFNILVFMLSFMFYLPLSVAFCPAQANYLSLGEIKSSQLVAYGFLRCYFNGFASVFLADLTALWFS